MLNCTYIFFLVAANFYDFDNECGMKIADPCVRRIWFELKSIVNVNSNYGNDVLRKRELELKLQSWHVFKRRFVSIFFLRFDSKTFLLCAFVWNSDFFFPLSFLFFQRIEIMREKCFTEKHSTEFSYLFHFQK